MSPDSTRAEHTLMAIRGFGVVTVALIGLVFAQSYNGRRDVVETQRQQCLSFDRRVLVPQLNVDRADLEGNRAIASDPRQSAQTRRARSREIVVEEDALLYMDQQVDPRTMSRLNPIGQKLVRLYQRIGKAYSCDRAYPAASPFQFNG